MENKVSCSIENLKVYFPIRAGLAQRTVGHIKAVDDVSLDIRKGETLGLVGESGCGKTTVGRAIVRLNEPTSGRILYDGQNILELKGAALRELRRKLQIVFQDPYSSLNPRQTVRRMLAEVLTVQMGMDQKQALERTGELLAQVGLSPAYAPRYPHEFSGGQRQRICIARALAMQPELIVCDESVSALDVSIQAQILNLMQDLQKELNLTYMFITHDLSVVHHISDDIMVMYLGQVIEKAPAEVLFANPVHPYTQALLSAIPVPSLHNRKERILMKGELTSPIDPKPECRFCSRCPYAEEMCHAGNPALKEIEAGHFVACCKFGV